MLHEIEQYLTVIENRLDRFAYYVNGLSPEALNWRPFGDSGDMDTSSLAVLVAHIAGSNRLYLVEAISGAPIHRDRQAEFSFAAASAAELVEMLQESKREARGILSALTNEDLEREIVLNERTFSARWAILHVINHMALHLGQMQLTYQMGHHGLAGASRDWFPEERLN